MDSVIALLKTKVADMLAEELAKEQQEGSDKQNSQTPSALADESQNNPIQLKQQKERKMISDEVLKPLREVDGYLASAIFDMSGEVLVKHNDSKYSVEVIGANAVAMINAALKAVSGAGLGKCNFIQVNSDLGIFGAVWAVEDQSVAAVLLETKANVGLAKMALAKVGEDARKKLS